MIFVVYFFMYITSYDVWNYFTHICLHKITLYKYHKYHHVIMYGDLSYTDAFAGHVIELPLHAVGMFIPHIFIEYHIRALLCAYIYVTIRTYLQHDHRCTWLVGNHHLLHHKHPKYNFGEKWIDYMLGTLYVPGTDGVYCEYRD